MAKFKMGFRNRPVQEQLDICERAVKNIVALAPQKRVDVDMDRLQDAVAAARANENHIAALRAELKAGLARRNEQLGWARNVVTWACAATAMRTEQTPQELLALGLTLEKPKTPIGLPEAPVSVRAESGREGEVTFRWKRPMRRCVFEVEFRAESSQEDGWQKTEMCCQQCCTIKGLASGLKHLFRTRAHNAQGTGPWSQSASARVK